MRRGSQILKGGHPDRRSSTPTKRVAFHDESPVVSSGVESLGPRASIHRSHYRDNDHDNEHTHDHESSEENKEDVKPLDILSMEIALAFDSRDTILSLLDSEISEIQSFQPSYILPLLELFSKRDFGHEDLQTLADPSANQSHMKSRIQQLKDESREKDAQLREAQEELARARESYFNYLNDHPGSSANDRRRFEDEDDLPPPPPRPTLLPHQHRPSFVEARQNDRKLAWKKWSGNQPIPYKTSGHLVHPDEPDGLTRSPLQLISIPFKPRVWQEERADGSGGQNKEKSKAEEIHYDALRRRHKSLHGADLQSLNLGDFALSFPDLARSIPCLQCLSDEDIEALDELVDEPRDYKENALIVKEGDPIATIFFVGAGSITCTQTVTDVVAGVKTATHTLSKGDLFGNTSRAAGTYVATGHVLLFTIPRNGLYQILARYSNPLPKDVTPTWDEASLIAHIEHFLQYLLMFTAEEQKVKLSVGGLNLPGQERLLGIAALTRKSIVLGRNRGGSLSTRGTISQFLAPDRATVANDAIINPELKRHLMLRMLALSSPEFDPIETTDNLIRLTKEFFDVDRVGLFRINKMKSTMSLRVSQQGDKPEIEMPLRGIGGHIAQTGNILNLPDCYESELFDNTMDLRTGYRTIQMMCVPAYSGPGNLTGVLQCINTLDNLPFAKSDETLCFMIAQQMGQVLGTILELETGGDYLPLIRVGTDAKLQLRLSTLQLANLTRPIRECMLTVTMMHGPVAHPIVHSTKYMPLTLAGASTVDVNGAKSRAAIHSHSCNLNDILLEWPLRDLPLASRIMIAVTSRASISRFPVGWCGIRVYGLDRRIRVGAVTTSLRDGALPIGVVSSLEKDASLDGVDDSAGSFIVGTLATTCPLPVVYEVPNQARDPSSKTTESSLLHENLSSTSDGTEKTLKYHLQQMTPVEQQRFSSLMHSHPSSVVLSAKDKDTIWRLRRVLLTKGSFLPIFLLCVDWMHLESVSEAYRLLHDWQPPGRYVALQLLGPHYPDPKVRAYAVEILSAANNSEHLELLAPLTHQLRCEVTHDSALARLLLRRAIDQPLTIGHAFFWCMQGSIHRPELSAKYRFYSQVYLRSCGDVQRAALSHAQLFMNILTKIADEVRAETKPSKRLSLLRQRLRDERLRFPAIFQHPCNPQCQTKGLIPQGCYVIETSAQKALFLLLENAKRGGRPFAMIFKTGVDPSGVVLAEQMLRTMNALLLDSDRALNHSTSETVLPRQIRELDQQTGVIDVQMTECLASYITVGDSMLTELSYDAVTYNNIARCVEKASRGGGDVHPKTKPNEKVAAEVPISSKLAGRTFPNDMVDNWLRICSMDPLASHAAVGAPVTENASQHSHRLGLKGGSTVQQRRNAFSGPSSRTLVAPPGTPVAERQYALHPMHLAWKDTFARSLAGFYLSSIVLNVVGRDADNILIRTTGHVFNIDVSALRLATKATNAREPVPLLPAFMQVLGGEETTRYKLFESCLLTGFTVLRRYMATLSNVVEIMLGGEGVPIDVAAGPIKAMSDNLLLDYTEAEAIDKFKQMIMSDKRYFSQCHGKKTYPAKPMSHGYFW